MRCIIAGSRYGVRYRDVERAVRESRWWDEIAVVLSGGAIGADRHGEQWADEHGREIEPYPVSKHDWHMHGKAAGPMRNRRMAEAADACIVVWDGESRGSRSMIYKARRVGLRVYVHPVFVHGWAAQPGRTE